MAASRDSGRGDWGDCGGGCGVVDGEERGAEEEGEGVYGAGGGNSGGGKGRG